MAFKDYYKILGLTKNATLKEIKKAYRQMARKYHPDLNPNDKVAEKKFTEINEANEVLSIPENRKKYDEYGEHWKYAEEYEKAAHQDNYQKNTKEMNKQIIKFYKETAECIEKKCICKCLMKYIRNVLINDFSCSEKMIYFYYYLIK